MLDDIEYTGANIEKTILEPSFGDGAFLIAIVERILEYATDETHLHTLLDKVYGYEIDSIVYSQAIMRLDTLLAQHGYTHVWKNLHCGDALLMPDGTFDYIIANPPFLRVHDLDVATRTYVREHYQFGQGMMDLYVIFMELGIKHLAQDGHMIYITPNSFLRNASQRAFRNYLMEHHLVHNITNYHTLPVFENILTYPAITHITYNNTQSTYIMMETLEKPAWQNTVDIDMLFHSMVSPQDIAFLGTLSGTRLGDICTIQYGVATNADSVYIGTGLAGSYTRSAIKASTLQTTDIIFPYDWTGSGYQVASERDLQKDALVYAHLFKNRSRLMTRDMDNGAQWYQFARSQGIQSSHHRKFVLKHILAPSQTTCEWVEVDENTIVYSGMYIVVHESTDIPLVKQILSSPDFCRYLKVKGKDMSGGYKTFNTKLVKDYRVAKNLEDIHEE